MKKMNLIGNGISQNPDYFEELIERVRIIRTSEMRTYDKVKELFKTCSDDYEDSPYETRIFYAKIQNKIHYAHTGKTATELIYYRADSSDGYMGLKCWENSPEGNIKKKDTIIAKNYLSEDELIQIRLFVDGLLGTIETISRNNNSKGMLMEDWVNLIDEYINLTNLNLLADYISPITRKIANDKAHNEYERYKNTQQNT